MMRRRHILSILSVLAGGGIAKAFTNIQKKKRTFVLVHGAWHGGWCWKKFSPLLVAAGHEVHTPTLTGLGERSHLLKPEIDLDTHIQDVTSVLEYEDLKDVILVGHSYGGMVITGVADKARNRVDHLIYLDAFLPDDGRALNNYVSISFEDMAKTKGDGWQVPLLGGSLEGLGITDKADIEWMSSRVGVQPLKTFTQALHLSGPLDAMLKKTYIQLTDNRPHFREAAQNAKRQGFQYYKLLTGGHDAMITKPVELAQIFDSMF